MPDQPLICIQQLLVGESQSSALVSFHSPSNHGYWCSRKGGLAKNWFIPEKQENEQDDKNGSKTWKKWDHVVAAALCTVSLASLEAIVCFMNLYLLLVDLYQQDRFLLHYYSGSCTVLENMNTIVVAAHSYINYKLFRNDWLVDLAAKASSTIYHW